MMVGPYSSSRMLPALIALLTAEILFADWLMPRGWAVWILYILPLLAAFWMPQRNASLCLAAVFTTLTVIGYFISAPGIAEPIAVFNRAVGIAVFWVTGLLIVNRKGTEQSSLDASEFSRQIIASAREGIVVYDRDLRYVVWNPFMEKWGGKSAKDVEGRLPWDVFPFLKAFDIESNLRRALAGETVTLPDMRHPVDLDGKPRWASATVCPLRNADGSIVGVISVIHDISERKRAEAERARLATIIESTPDFVSICDPNMRFRYLNPAVRRAIGVADNEDITGLTGRDFRAPADFEKLMNEIIPAVMRDGSWFGESRWRARDGRMLSISQIVFAHRSEDGAVESISTVARDISERKRIEQTVRDAEQQLRRVLNTLPAMVGILTPDGTLLDGNRLPLEMFGLQLEQVIGRPFADLYPWSTSPALQAELREALRRAAQGEVVHYDVELPTPSGRSIVSEIWITPLKDEAGSVTHLIASGVDITERKRIEEALRESQVKLNLAMRTAKMGSWSCDLNTGHFQGDAASLELHGFAAGESITTLDQGSRHIHPDDISEIQRRFERALSTRGVYENEYRVVQPDGSIHWIYSLGSVPQGSSYLLGMLQDITERKRAEESIRQSNLRLQALSRKILEVQENERRHLARELHDELGQVLTMISVGLKVVKERGDPAMLEECIANVDGVIQQMRNLSLELRPAMLDDLGLATTLRWYVQRHAERTGIHVDLVTESTAGEVPTEVRNACFRVAQEALTNVVRHGKAQNVRVELLQREEEVQLTVEDDGVGFDVAAARRRAAHGGSVGILGMQERVELLGGEFDVRSTPGQGAIICARFPLTTDD